MRDSVKLKSRLLTTAFVLPLSVSMALAPAWGFDVTGDSDGVAVTDTVQVSAPQDDDDNAITQAEGIIVNGSPSGTDNAALILDDDSAVVIDGEIVIRDREGEEDGAATYTLNQAVGIKITTPFTGNNLSLKSGLLINISEVLGPDNNDTDDDGIIEDSPAIGTAQRIGLWVDEAITGSLIGEGGSIRVDGNGARGVQIDGALSGNFDFSTAIDNGRIGGILGDNAIGVDINGAIGGYYRQRGNVDVRGEGSVGIDIGNVITGSFMIESSVNSTGYSGYSSSPVHGRDESDEDAAANTDERRRGGAAVNINANVVGGVIIGGIVNLVSTDEESTSLTTISNARYDYDDDAETGNDVTAQKTLPYHYDENRNFVALLTSHGEADDTATLHISADIGTDGSVETVLDTENDDGLSTTDAYRSGLKQFFYSHGLVNRGTVSANGLYDGFKADAVLLDGGAMINGGVYNNGTISATAYNQNATAIEFGNVILTDGLRDDGSVFLNEGAISSTVSTHDGVAADVADDDYTATTILLTGDASFTTDDGTPLFINRRFIDAKSVYYNEDGARSDGANAIALNAENLTDDFDLTQEFFKSDALLTPGDANTNSAPNPYLGGGDTDIDDNDDGVIDTRDVDAPQIIGDIKFGAGANVFAIKAGTVTGDISFGGGTDALNLSNEIADDDGDDYTAPITSFRGRITNSDTLNVTIGDRAELHFDGQEGDVASSSDDYNPANDTEGLALSGLTLTGDSDLLMTIYDEKLDNELIDVNGALALSNDARIVPALVGLTASDTASTTVKLIEYDTLTINNEIDHYLSDETPFIYDVELIDDDENSVISAIFTTKNAIQIGLEKPTEIAAYNAVLEHFRANEELEMAVIDITDEEDFAAAYRHLFPHYSDGTARQLSGLADMATGAVSQHLQLVNAGGRRGGDGWLQQFGDYRRQDSSANGHTVSGNSYAIALGYDLPVSVIDALGLYMQMGFTAVNEKSTSRNEVTSESFTYGAYLSDKIGPLRYQLNAAYGLVDLESSRFANFNGVADSLTADWDATSTSASARIAYPILEDGHLLRLEAGMDYFRLEHDDYRETDLMDNALAMHVAGGESDKTSQFIGLRGGYRTAEDEGSRGVAIKWEPNYYLGWRSTSDFTPYEATANFVGTNSAAGSFKLKSHIEPEDAIDVGLGLAAHNDYFAFEFNYRARFADDEETHGGGISIRLLF
jgi:uncharacterized protein with beta-barrel porin domain